MTQSVDEIPRPVVLNEKLGPLIAEFGGERLRLGYLVFLRDPYAAKCNPPFPFGLFMSQAKRHVPRADQVAPAAGPVYRQHKAGDDPYADPPKKGGA